MARKVTLEKIRNLCKRRGFVIQSSEIYGGFSNVYDYGPLGARLKNNIKQLWINEMIDKRENVFLIDGAILMHPKAWEASGHVASFTDPLLECKKCRKRHRADQLEGWELKKDNKTGKFEVLKQGDLTCPACGAEMDSEVRAFNMMLETYVGGILKDYQASPAKTYLKPESCQNLYLDYQWVKDSMRAKLPFGIAQIGKAFRNELTTGQYLFRTREFEQMDIEFYCNPKKADKWYREWKEIRWNWYTKTLGISKKNLRWRQHSKDELIFYAKDAWDIEYKYDMGWKELEGLHNRSDYDLAQHGKFSGKKFEVVNQKTGEKFIPYVIECSGGVDRTLLTVLSDFYDEEAVEDVNGRKYDRVVMRFPEKLAPYKFAVLPLMKKPKLVKKAKEVFEQLKDKSLTMYDETGSIGKRYRRQDEIGTPRCITIDYDTLKDDTVTIRDRDSMKQQRVSIEELV